MARGAGVRQGDAFAGDANPTLPGARLIVGQVGAEVALRLHVLLAIILSLAFVIPLTLTIAFSLPFLFPVLGRRGEWDGAEDETRGDGGRRAQETAAVNIPD
jgi:hypothetical protein